MMKVIADRSQIIFPTVTFSASGESVHGLPRDRIHAPSTNRWSCLQKRYAIREDRKSNLGIRSRMPLSTNATSMTILQQQQKQEEQQPLQEQGILLKQLSLRKLGLLFGSHRMVGPNWADLSNVSFASQHPQLAEGDVSYPLALL